MDSEVLQFLSLLNRNAAESSLLDKYLCIRTQVWDCVVIFLSIYKSEQNIKLLKPSYLKIQETALRKFCPCCSRVINHFTIAHGHFFPSAAVSLLLSSSQKVTRIPSISCKRNSIIYCETAWKGTPTENIHKRLLYHWMHILPH